MVVRVRRAACVVDTFVRRATPSDSWDEVRVDDPALANYLRIEERELEREPASNQYYFFCPGDQRGLALALGVRVRAR